MTNPKFKLIEIIFGPLMRFVESKNITGWVVPIVFAGIIIIWDLKKRELRKRKNIKPSTAWKIQEFTLFLGFLISIIYGIYDQIRILRNLR